MPVIPAAGAEEGSVRQSPSGTLASLSWLNVASTCMIVPSEPACKILRASSIATS